MGKIRIKTLGDEKKEKADKKKAQIRSGERKMSVTDKKSSVEKTQITNEAVKELNLEQPSKSDKTSKIIATQKSKKNPAKKQKHSKNYLAIAKIIDKNKKYSLTEALEQLPKLKRAKFDETVELHINTLEKSISGSFVFPHGTGKQIRICIVNQSEDPKHVEETVKKVETGKIDFDLLIATPDSMPRLARVAKFLGPRGLMPNPKNGTVTPKPEIIAQKYQAGQINFKTEAKFPIIHLIVGKVSFGDKKLTDNIKTALSAIQSKNIKNITLKSTMSPGMKLEITDI